MAYRVAVIVPTLNEEGYIARTLQAISAQKTSFDYDLVVCDGGSTDKTVEIAARHARILNSPIRGKSEQLNFAATNLSCDILVFLDADTIIPQNYLQYIHDLFEKDNDLWACSANFKHCSDGFNWWQKFKIWFVNFHMPRFYDFHSLFKITKLPGCNICIRHKIFMEVGGFKNLPNEDSELSLTLRELAKKKKFGRIKYLRGLTVLCSPRTILEYGPIGIFIHYSKRGMEAKRKRKGQ